MHERLWLMAFVLALLVVPAVPAWSKPLVIVEDGQPRAVIVVEAESEKAQQAAQALQTYIEKISGAELPLVTEGQDGDAKHPVRLLVGHTQAAQQAGVQIPAGYDPSVRKDVFEEEGFVLKSLDDAVIIAGNNDGPYQGTIYAAYDLLQRLGCRWYFPGEWGEVIPQQKTIELPDLDVTSRPDFAVRSIWLSGWVPVTAEERAEYAKWGTKIGFNAEQLYPLVGDGFLAGLVPPEEYFEEHPEYFAMGEDGQRHARVDSIHHTMLCLSNPDVVTESIKNLELAFAGEKKMGIVAEHGFGISPPDGTPYCYCPECKAQSQNFQFPRYVHRTMQSEEFFAFAAELARAFPDKWVATMAYSLREIVPQGVEIPENIAVTIAPISSDVLHPNDTHLWRRRDFVRNLKAWRERTPHVMIYDYNPGFLSGMWLPERDAANMAINAKIYRDIDIKGMNREGRKAFMQTWISYYVTARMLWDADADLETLKQDFYATFFGPEAGPHVRAWWDACEQVLFESEMQAHEDFLVNHIYTLDFAKEIQPHIEAARQAQMTDAQRQRFEAVDLIAQHFTAHARMQDAEREMDYATAAQAAQAMIDLRARLYAISPFLIGDKFNPSSFFAEGRKVKFEELADKAGGDQGELIAPLPLEMKFQRDPFNEGIVGEWFAPDHDDSGWSMKDTFYTWEQLEPAEDEAGHDWDGIGWYRASFEVPADVQGRQVKLWLGGTMNEGWVWINGQYVGHQGHKLWWSHPHDFELDVTEQIQPGQTNTVAIRVLNDAEHGGLFRRGFFYVAKE